MMKMLDAKALLEEKKMDAATILGSLSIVRIRRLASEMGMPLARATWRGRKAEIVAAFLAAQAPALSPLVRVARFFAGKSSWGSMKALADTLHGTDYEAVEACLERPWATATKEERDAFFLEELEARLAKCCGDAAAEGMQVVEAAAQRLADCIDEREAHGWTVISSTWGDRSTENAAFLAAEKAFREILTDLNYGKDIARAARLEAIAQAISAAEVEKYSVQARAWQNYGKTRIYVRVFDEDGREQPEVLYVDLDKKGIFWKSTPKVRPEWTDAILAAAKAAVA